MIVFNEKDPYPLLSLDSYTYKEAQDHAARIDQFLGFNLEQIEDQIRQNSLIVENAGSQQNWEHLPVQAMQTPYVELRNILSLLDPTPHSHIVDLGCAYARMAFILGQHYPQVRFSGYELEGLRVQEAQRVLHSFHYPNVQILTQDLTSVDFRIPLADIYFIFDYGTPAAVRQTLQDLKEIALSRKIRVVARGKLVRFWIHKENPWLGEINEPLHFDHFSIYNS